MNESLMRGVAALCVCMLLPAPGRALPLPQFAKRPWGGPQIHVQAVEGITERIMDGKLHLRLKDFLQLALNNNTEILLTKLDVLTAADAIIASRAPLDPALRLDYSSVRTQTPQYSQIGGASTLNTLAQQGNIGYQQVLSSGQTVNLGFTSYRDSSNNAFNYFNPSITTGLNMQIMQPLLQNRSRIQWKAPMKIAATQFVITTDQSEARIADLIATAARQYWDAVQARDNIRVAELSVTLAQKSYDRDKLALELGALSPLEIYQSQSQVAQRKVTVIQAEAAYRDALDVLRRIIGADLRKETRNVEIVLEEEANSLATLPPDLNGENAIASAVASRPELRAVQRHLGVDEWNARLAQDNLKPRFDLGVQFGGAGLGGNQIPVSGPLGSGPSAFIPGGLGDSLGQLFGFQAPYYGFVAQMTLPLRSSTARASLADAMVNRTRDQYQARQIEQQIILEVKTALNQLNTATEEISASKLARDLAQKNVDAQQQKYEIGGITAFELLDAQNRLASLEGSLVASYTDYQKALVSYKRATWTLLDGLGVIVEVPADYFGR